MTALGKDHGAGGFFIVPVAPDKTVGIVVIANVFRCLDGADATDGIFLQKALSSV